MRFNRIFFLALFSLSLFGDNFLLDDEKAKNPKIFNSQPEKLSKDELVYRVKADENGIKEYSKKISTLKVELKKVQAKVTSVTAENSKLKKEQDAYLEKIEKLSSRLEDLESILTTQPDEHKDIESAYKRLKQEYKRLELASSLKANDGYRTLQLEKENMLLKQELKNLIKEMEKKKSPNAFVGGTSIMY